MKIKKFAKNVKVFLLHPDFGPWSNILTPRYSGDQCIHAGLQVALPDPKRTVQKLDTFKYY